MNIRNSWGKIQLNNYLQCLSIEAKQQIYLKKAKPTTCFLRPDCESVQSVLSIVSIRSISSVSVRKSVTTFRPGTTKQS